MSVIFDAMIVVALHEREAVEALNVTLYHRDTARHQQFGKVDMDKGGAGGTKSFCTDIYAAAFNHLTPSDVEEAIIAAPWRFPDWVLYVCDLGDYHQPDYGDGPCSLLSRTVSELRVAA